MQYFRYSPYFLGSVIQCCPRSNMVSVTFNIHFTVIMALFTLYIKDEHSYPDTLPSLCFYSRCSNYGSGITSGAGSELWAAVRVQNRWRWAWRGGGTLRRREEGKSVEAREGDGWKGEHARTEIMMVDKFKYLESIIQNNGQHTRKVKKRAQEWVETGARGDLWQKESSKSERESLQEYPLWA